MQNPFTLTFGKSPLEPVERPVQMKEIIDTFTGFPSLHLQFFSLYGLYFSEHWLHLEMVSKDLE